MKIKFNNKGFTLIELLAVIAILAVIMLIGGNSVFGALEHAQKGAFKTEVGYAIQAAQSAYQVDLLNQKVKNTAICYPISWLITNEFYKKEGADATSYNGSVLVKTAVGGGNAQYTIWMQNSSFIVSNGTLNNLSTEGSGDGAIVTRSETSASTNCNGQGVIKGS